MDKIGFIGGGNMAEALIKGIIKSGAFKGEQILVSDIKNERLEPLNQTYKVSTISDNKTLAGTADIIILSVEPQQMAGVIEEIKNSFKADTLFITIAAGKKSISFRITYRSLEATLEDELVNRRHQEITAAVIATFDAGLPE